MKKHRTIMEQDFRNIRRMWNKPLSLWNKIIFRQPIGY